MQEHQWIFPIAYQLTPPDMKALGLWVSSHANGSIYAEPGLFVITPDQKIQIMGSGNTAFCRPGLEILLDGVKGIQSRGLAVTGTIEL